MKLLPPCHRPGVSARVGVALIAAALAVGISSCASVRSLAASPEERAADQHAVTAGVVMTRGYRATSARDAAWRVVGHVADTTIEALLADGTNHNGRVVLRITVDTTDGSEFDSPATRCYEYRFRWSTSHTATPERIDDCSGAALTLQPPARIDMISESSIARLLRVLARIGPAQRHDPTLIRREVTRLFGPPAKVAVGPTTSGDFEVAIHAGSECAFALVPSSGKPSLIDAGSGLQCSA